MKKIFLILLLVIVSGCTLKQEDILGKYVLEHGKYKEYIEFKKDGYCIINGYDDNTIYVHKNTIFGDEMYVDNCSYTIKSNQIIVNAKLSSNGKKTNAFKNLDFDRKTKIVSYNGVNFETVDTELKKDTTKKLSCNNKDVDKIIKLIKNGNYIDVYSNGDLKISSVIGGQYYNIDYRTYTEYTVSCGSYSKTIKVFD